MGVLVELTKSLYEQGILLEKQLNGANAPLPSLDAGTPSLYPPPKTHPEIFATRNILIGNARDILQLALGPAEVLRSMVGPEKMRLAVLNFVERLNLASHIPQDGSISISQLATALDVNEINLERILRFAFSFHLFKESPPDHVAHTALSQALPILSGWTRLQLRPDIQNATFAWPQALRRYCEASDQDHQKSPWNFGNHTESAFFEVIGGEEHGLQNFSLAMDSHARVTGGSDKSYFLEGFDWDSLGEGPLVDLGGANGHVAVAIAEAFHQLRVIVQDLPSNEAAAQDTIPSSLRSRVTFRAQDFFLPQPTDLAPKAYLLKSVMHDWNDDDCIRILKNLVTAVERGARIFIMDRVPPRGGAVPSYHESMNLFMDLLMFSVLGAKERTAEEWSRLLTLTDERLRIIRLEQPIGCEFGMLEIGM